MADSGLRCPACEYNLTGVTEQRCPECGNRFNRAYLRAVAAGAPEPIPIWDDDGRFLLYRFVHLCVLGWLAPHRLGRMFPRRYPVRSARRFRRAATLAGLVAPIMLPSMVGLDASVLPKLWGVLIGCVFGMLIAESMLALALRVLFAPPVPERRVTNDAASESWAGLVGMLRPFIVPEILALTLMLAGIGLSWSVLSPLAAALAIYVFPLWWMIALGIVLYVQNAPRRSRLVAISLVPFVVFIGACIGVACGVIAGAMLSDLLPAIGIKV